MKSSKCVFRMGIGKLIHNHIHITVPQIFEKNVIFGIVILYDFSVDFLNFGALNKDRFNELLQTLKFQFKPVQVVVRAISH